MFDVTCYFERGVPPFVGPEGQDRDSLRIPISNTRGSAYNRGVSRK